jgi:hypothetical protein
MSVSGHKNLIGAIYVQMDISFSYIAQSKFKMVLFLGAKAPLGIATVSLSLCP